ncbi:MAG TPA: alpha/beta hydrolase [Novosphingobium sp.]|nr:alpha/beta hydrolase [Novosphingobium sp.]
MSDTEHFVREDVQGFLAFLNSQPGPKMSEMPLADARQAYVAMKPLAEADARALAVIEDLTCPGPGGDIPLRLYDARATREPGPVIVFFHGGGFVIGDLETHHNLCTEIAAEMDLPVVAVDYRLAPEHPFPAAPDDCEAAARWVAGSPAALGRKCTGLIPLGDSAGGNLTIVVTQALGDNPAAAPVIMQVPIYPATDERPDHPSMLAFGENHLLTKDTMDWFMDSYAGEPGNKRAYPIHGNHAAAPPTVLVTASLDPIRDGGRLYGAHLIQAGVDVVFLEMKGSIHGFTTLRKAIPSAQADTHAILAAMKLLLARF